MKSQLAQFFTLDVQSANQFSVQSASQFSVQTLQVIDGGALLHRITWPKKSTYKKIVEQYVCYIQTKYGHSSCIVFDGYKSGPSTRDMSTKEEAERQVQIFI